MPTLLQTSCSCLGVCGQDGDGTGLQQEYPAIADGPFEILRTAKETLCLARQLPEASGERFVDARLILSFGDNRLLTHAAGHVRARLDCLAAHGALDDAQSCVCQARCDPD